MTAIVLRGDARNLPLPDASVDLICTSPPYFALRSYTDGGEHYAGQIGSESTPQEYIAALVECTREWVRVLKPAGSIWVNLGDKYSGGDGSPGGPSRLQGGKKQRAVQGNGWRGRTSTPAKSLMLLPERYRIAAVDQLGLIARAVIIWSKPNGLPESVTDRVRRSHEDWVHLVKQPRYYSAVDEIREQHVRTERPWELAGRIPESARRRDAAGASSVSGDKPDGKAITFNPLGKLPGSVWTVPTEPLTVPAELGVDHFAAFPTEWPRRIIQGWSPSGICTACGEGRRPVVETMRERSRPVVSYTYGGPGRKPYAGDREPITATIVGEACACPEPTAPTRPAVVLDPFGGTGTSSLVAHALGRTGITVDRSADYSRLAQWRTSDPGQLAKVLGVPKPPPQLDGQAGLFEVAS